MDASMNRSPSELGSPPFRLGTWVVLYDGDCCFCRQVIKGLADGKWNERIDYVPFQTEGVFDQLPVSRQQARQNMILLNWEGQYWEGGAAMARLLALFPGWKGSLGWWMQRPILRTWTAWGYQRVAHSRSLWSKLIPTCWE